MISAHSRHKLGGFRIQGRSRLHIKYGASLGYIVRLYLQNKTKHIKKIVKMKPGSTALCIIGRKAAACGSPWWRTGRRACAPDSTQDSVQLPVSTQVSWFLVSCRTGNWLRGSTQGIVDLLGKEEGKRGGGGEKAPSRNVSYLQFVRNPNGNYRLTEDSCEKLRNLTSTGLEGNSGANWLMRSMLWKN